MRHLNKALKVGALLCLVCGGLLFGPGLNGGQSAAATEETYHPEVGGGFSCGPDCCSVHNILCCPGTTCREGET